MQIFREPQIYVLGRQTVDQAELDRFLADYHFSAWTTDASAGAEAMSEIGGRVCYMSFAAGRKSNHDYLAHILEVGHGSVLEHAVWNFLVVGVSRSLTHELIRHRVGMSPSQLSQRFHVESDCDFVEPEIIAEDPELHALFLEAIEHDRRVYAELLDKLSAKLTHIPEKTARRKMACQAARSILPNATETKIFLTFNARALRHFIELRGSKDADAEIRRLAVAFTRVMQREAPSIFADYVIESVPHAGECVSTAHPHV